MDDSDKQMLEAAMLIIGQVKQNHSGLLVLKPDKPEKVEINDTIYDLQKTQALLERVINR